VSIPRAILWRVAEYNQPREIASVVPYPTMKPPKSARIKADRARYFTLALMSFSMTRLKYAALAGVMLLSACDGSKGVYTLYRSSPDYADLRIQVATFDAADGAATLARVDFFCMGFLSLKYLGT
jgi:hypothetical protein